MLPARMVAQVPASDSSRQFLVITGESRWLNGGQPVAFNRMKDWFPETLEFDSTQATPGGTRVFLSPRFTILGDYTTSRTTVTRDRSGHVTDIASYNVRFLSNACGPIAPLTTPLEIDESLQEEADLTTEMRVLAPFFEASPVAGREYRRQIAFSIVKGLSRSQVSGVRISKRIGDSVVNRRHYLIVRDSASLSARETRIDPNGYADWDHGADSIPLIERVVAGTVVGKRLVEAITGQTAWLADTTAFHGTATLRLADGRTFTSPTRFDQAEEVARLNGVAAEVQSQAAFARQRAAEFSGVADSATSRRIAQHDPGVRDSLMRLFRFSQRAAQRDSAMEVLRFGYALGWEEVLRAKLEAGDTAEYLRYFTDKWATPDLYALVRSALADPGVAFDHGMERSWFLHPVVHAMLGNPPALVADTAKWPCRPAVCRALASEWPAAPDPRFRETGLVARFVLDPVRWADTVIALARSGHVYLTDAAALASGEGTLPFGGAASPTAIPAPGAPWDAWSRWMTGTRQYPLDTFPKLVDFNGAHRVAIEMRQLITGRQFTNEFAGRFRAATNDTERFVFGTMLDALAPDYRSRAEISAAFDAGSELDRELAYHHLAHAFGPYQPADSATIADIAGRLIAMLAGRGQPWPPMPGSMPGQETTIRPDTLPLGTPRYFVADSLPRWVRDSVAAAGYVVRASGWRRVDTTTSVTVHVGPIRQLGPLTLVEAKRVTVLPGRAGTYQGNQELWGFYLYHGSRGWQVFTPRPSGRQVGRFCTVG